VPPRPSALPPAELLGDDYVDCHKLKIKSNTGNGVTYTVAAERDGATDSDIKADVSLQFPLYERRGTCTTKFFTSGKGTAEIKLDNLGVKGLTTTLLAGVGKDVGVATVEFKHGPVGLTTAYDVYGKAAAASLAAAFAPQGYAGFFVAGVDGVVAGPEFNADRADFALSYYDGAESEATVHVTDKGQKAMLSYSHHVRSGFSVASQFKYDKVKDSATLQFGGAARLDGVTVVKAKIDSHGLCAMSYVQDIRAKTSLILSTKFDVTSLDSAKVGISLALD
jgi:hypothetical protein